jgi:putative endonuclease
MAQATFPELAHRRAGARSARRSFPAGWPAEVVAVNPKDLLGQQGEQLAAKFLTDAGLSVLGRNWRCTLGEIDIVALDGRTLVVCEVKTRSGVRFGTPVEAITRQKAQRLRRLAVAWVRAHGLVFDQIRIDVIGVLRAASGDFSIEHVRGVG